LTATIEIGKCGESCIFVQDNGIGISPEEIDSLLRPFSNTKNGQSAGQLNIGFAITKKIIERHGGKLEIVSEFDKGTTVRFDFSSVS
jgi:signal transduction histidine kinase